MWSGVKKSRPQNHSSQHTSRKSRRKWQVPRRTQAEVQSKSLRGIRPKHHPIMWAFRWKRQRRPSFWPSARDARGSQPQSQPWPMEHCVSPRFKIVQVRMPDCLEPACLGCRKHPIHKLTGQLNATSILNSAYSCLYWCTLLRPLLLFFLYCS